MTQIDNLSLGNGVNLQPSYYHGGNVNFGWELMQQYPDIQTVRIEIEPGHELQAGGWIAQAQSHGYQVIATYHKHTVLGSNLLTDLLAAANWWKNNYHNLGSGFIINLSNEWGNHDILPVDYAHAYNQAIAVVRQVYNGSIIIDLPGWGQDTHIALSALKATSYEVITDPAIVLSVHIYSNSWNAVTHRALSTDDLDLLAGSGRPCLVGEFGVQGTGGDCDWSGCVDHAKQLGWTVLGWCWNGDGEGFNMVTPSWQSQPSPSDFQEGQYFHTIYDRLGGLNV